MEYGHFRGRGWRRKSAPIPAARNGSRFAGFGGLEAFRNGGARRPRPQNFISSSNWGWLSLRPSVPNLLRQYWYSMPA